MGQESVIFCYQREVRWPVTQEKSLILNWQLPSIVKFTHAVNSILLCRKPLYLAFLSWTLWADPFQPVSLVRGLVLGTRLNRGTNRSSCGSTLQTTWCHEILGLDILLTWRRRVFFSKDTIQPESSPVQSCVSEPRHLFKNAIWLWYSLSCPLCS